MIRPWQILLASAVLLLPACGRKTPVKPPELAAPKQIADLRADNRPDGIQLTWGRPRVYEDDSRMLNLAGFRVERSSGEAKGETLGELRLTDQERFQQTRQLRYLDRTALPNAEYQYRVFAFTLDGYVSRPSNLVVISREPPTPPAPSP